MANISNLNSIFEIAFGVNAVSFALLSRLRKTKQQLASFIENRIKQIDGNFELLETEKRDFVDFVFRSSNGLKIAHYAGLIAASIAAFATFFSIFVLLFSAEYPQIEIPIKDATIISICLLLLCPAIYMLYDRFLGFLVTAKIEAGIDDDKAKTFQRCFKLTQGMKKTIEDTDKTLAEIKSESFKINIQLQYDAIKYKLSLALDKIKLFFHRLFRQTH